MGRIGKSVSQGLKPAIIGMVYERAEEAAEKGGSCAESGEMHVPGAKARIDSAPVMPGLKSRPIPETTFQYPLKPAPFKTDPN